MDRCKIKRIFCLLLTLAMVLTLLPQMVFSASAETDASSHIHNYQSTVITPTCTEVGYTTYTCVCGDSYVDDCLNPADHTFGDWHLSKEPSFDQDGEESRECIKCSYVEFRSVKLTVIASGNFGYGTTPTDKVTYTIYSNGTMIVEGEGATYNCNWDSSRQPFKEYRDQVKHLIIRKGITVISRGSFAFFNNLETVSFPNTVTELQGNSFMASFVEDVSSIVIPESVNTIGVTAFGYTSGTFFRDITIENPDINFPDKSNPFYHAVFNHGRSPQKTTLYSYGNDNNVSRYAKDVGCNYIDLSTYKTGEFEGINYVFYNGVLTLSTEGENKSIPSKNAPWNERRDTITKIVIEDGITGIFANAFADYTALEKVELPDGLKTVGNGAFSTSESCSKELAIVFPRRIETVGNNIFTNRSNVKITAYYDSPAAEISEPGVEIALKKQFKFLMIGNSLTNDAANRSQGMVQSQMHDILQTMLGEDAEITIGVVFNGGKSLSWYATQTELDTKFSLGVISSDNNKWSSAGSFTIKEALSWTDWDAVSLQPYSLNVSSASENVYYPEEVDKKFIPLETASEYMLDCIAKYAAQADALCYMHWSMTNDLKTSAGLNTYNQFAKFYPVVLDYAGTETGKQFQDIVPVGLSVQNARTTYFALLNHNGAETVNLENDPQIGLQRDSVHISFNIGRYIAGLTFAETIIPEEMRAEGYVLPDIRITESVGRLPKEYTEIAQKSVFAAVNGWKNGSLAVTNIEGYEADPTVAAEEALQSAALEIACAANAEKLTDEITQAALAALPEDFAVDSVTATEGALIGDSFSCDVTLRFGYTRLTVTVPCTVTEHLYTPTVTAPTCTEQGYTTHTCACGDRYVDSHTEALGHSYEKGTCTLCGEEDPEYVMPGDMDGDGKLSDWDAIMLARYLAGWNVTIDLKAADIDGDGEISDWDGILLDRYLAGWNISIG